MGWCDDGILPRPLHEVQWFRWFRLAEPDPLRPEELSDDFRFIGNVAEVLRQERRTREPHE